MRLHVFFLILFLSLFLASCKTGKVVHSRKTLEIENLSVIQMPLVVDLIINETKVSGKATDVEMALTIEELKDIAVSDAIKKAGCDILIDPTFETSVKGWKTEVIVTGYPGSYKNFRSLSQEDIQTLKIFNSIDGTPHLLFNQADNDK